MNRNSVIQNIFMECQQTTQRKPEVVVFQDNLETDKTIGITDIEKDGFSVNNIPQIMDKIIFESIPFEKIGLRNK